MTLRSLEIGEAQALARRICGAEEALLARALAALESLGGRSRSVAQVYRACERTG